MAFASSGNLLTTLRALAERVGVVQPEAHHVAAANAASTPAAPSSSGATTRDDTGWLRTFTRCGATGRATTVFPQRFRGIIA